jgi:hypothetical protein
MMTTTAIEIVNAYDDKGAAMYIAVILIWYSTGLAFMLFLQMRPRSVQNHFLLDKTKSTVNMTSRRNPFADYHHIEADNAKKQILNELKDPERRQRLWKIYYSSKEEQNEPHPQYYQTITTDNAAIGRINRKLATIHRMVKHNHDDFIMPPSESNDNRLTSSFETMKFLPKRFISQRRPIESMNSHRMLPLIRVHSQPNAPSTSSLIGDTEEVQCHDQTLSTDVNSESRKRTSKFRNRFTVEKVSETNRNCSILTENTTE